jgi:DNA-binding NarL/FixJ family response regulator
MRHTTYEDASLDEVLVQEIAEDSSWYAGSYCQKNRQSPTSLTPRETQILRWVADGRTNKQIAKLLSRSTRTVEYHRNRLMRKLDAHTAAEMVKQAVKMGML